MLEKHFQAGVIRELKERFPGCVVLKNDSGYLQGFPDILVLYKDKWAVLECKKSEREHRQPNQEYYVDKLNKMSFSRFICPENKEQIFYELQCAFEPRRKTRIFERQQDQLAQL